MLLKAAEIGRLDIVRWIVDHDLEICNEEEDDDNFFPPSRVTSLGGEARLAIHIAAVNGHLDVAKYLHENADTPV